MKAPGSRKGLERPPERHHLHLRSAAEAAVCAPTVRAAAEGTGIAIFAPAALGRAPRSVSSSLGKVRTD